MHDTADVTREEIREWLEDLLEVKFTSDDWVRELDNGVILCQLLEKIDPSFKVKYSKRAAGVWVKRDNLSLFLDVLKDKIALEPVVLFEITDLLPQEGQKGKDENVISCLYHLSRVAHERFGVRPPGMVQAELEIEAEEEMGEEAIDEILERQGSAPPHPVVEEEKEEEKEEEEKEEEKKVEEEEAKEEVPREEEEARPPPVVYKPVKGDEIDEKLAENVNKAGVGADVPTRVVRVKKGQYIILPQKKVMHMRVLRGMLMVRVGGGWSDFHSWLAHMQQFSASHFASKNISAISKPVQRAVDKAVEKADVLEESTRSNLSGTQKSTKPLPTPPTEVLDAVEPPKDLPPKRKGAEGTKKPGARPVDAKPAATPATRPSAHDRRAPAERPPHAAPSARRPSAPAASSPSRRRSATAVVSGAQPPHTTKALRSTPGAGGQSKPAPKPAPKTAPRPAPKPAPKSAPKSAGPKAAAAAPRPTTAPRTSKVRSATTAVPRPASASSPSSKPLAASTKSLGSSKKGLSSSAKGVSKGLSASLKNKGKGKDGGDDEGQVA
eukprot:Sspe_Gene.64945::Locus_38465_Transcript_1_1_Confidence_1.000_Length_2090::g.64945::m.64945